MQTIRCILVIYAHYYQVTLSQDILEKMEYSHICDSVIDYALLYGELISFTTWKTRKEEYRRPINFFETRHKNSPLYFLYFR